VDRAVDVPSTPCDVGDDCCAVVDPARWVTGPGAGRGLVRVVVGGAGFGSCAPQIEA
jgi:hypothetical protein